MSGASDKARYHLERSVPTLQLLSRLSIFTPAELTSLTTQRSTFEHTLSARGSTPLDYARYAAFETNLAALITSRCARKKIRSPELRFAGQRAVFYILDRGTKKFPGDMGLWMQYISFCEQEGAHRKLAKVFTGVLRLRPREWGVWVKAAKYYAEVQGDMTTARGYLQRGLRFCPVEEGLWGEYVRLEMGWLGKVAARKRILGLDGETKTEEEEVGKEDEDEKMEDATAEEDMIALPTVTAADFDSEPPTTTALAAIAKTTTAPAYTGALPIAIIDACLASFPSATQPALASRLFDIVALFPFVPATPAILTHVLASLTATTPEAVETFVCDAKLRLLGLAATSLDFPVKLGEALKCFKRGLNSVTEKERVRLAERAVEVLAPFVEDEEADEDVRVVLLASVERYLRVISKAEGRRRKLSPLVNALVEGLERGERITAEAVRIAGTAAAVVVK